MKVKIGVLLVVLLALCAPVCTGGLAQDDPLSGTAWLNAGGMLYVFGNDSEATIVSRNEDSSIEARQLFYRSDGSYVLLRDTWEDEGLWLLIGDLSSGKLYIEGRFADRMEISAEEPTEAPGVAGGWTDEKGNEVLLMQPDGHFDELRIETGEQALNIGRYTHYGPYVVFEAEGQTIWIFYDAAGDEMGDGQVQIHRIPLEEAIALGLDVDSTQSPEPSALEPAATPEPVAERSNTGYEGPLADWMQDTAWLGPDDTLYVFGHYGQVTIVSQDENGMIQTRSMYYLADGTQVLLQEMVEANGEKRPTYLRGERVGDRLIWGGIPFERLSIGEGEEPMEAPGIAGGWIDETGVMVLFHPDGRMSAVPDTPGGQLIEAGGYVHYGSYVALTYEQKTQWVLYDAQADVLTYTIASNSAMAYRKSIAHRMPPDEALAYGLGQKAKIHSSVDLTGEWIAQNGEWLHIAGGKLSYASRSLHPEMMYTVEEDGTLVAYFETNLSRERMELGVYRSDESGEVLSLEQDYYRASADALRAQWSTPGWAALMMGIQAEDRAEWGARAQSIAADTPAAEPAPANIGRVTLALDEGAMTRYFGDAADKAVCESISPDGNCLLAVVNGALVLVDLPTGERREVTPDYGRSVGNAQTGMQNFEQVLSLWHPEYFGAEEVAWSPDGRYAVFTCRRMAVVQMNFLLDLLVVDTLNAQVFDAASFGKQTMGNDSSGAIAGACFGDDGMLYYLLYSKATHPMALMRLDINTGQSELLYRYPNDAFSLQWLDGRLLCIGMPISSSTQPSAIYSYSARSAVLEDQTLCFPLQAWPQHLSVSRKSGMGLAYIQLNRSFFGRGGFSVSDGRDGFAGYNRIALVTADGTGLAYLDTAQWLDLTAQGEEAALNTLLEQYRFCANAQLTFGGEYALLLHGTGDRLAMSLLRLRDLTLYPVDADLSREQLAGCVYDTRQAAKYPAGYRCFPGGWMIVGGRLAQLTIE